MFSSAAGLSGTRNLCADQTVMALRERRASRATRPPRATLRLCRARPYRAVTRDTTARERRDPNSLAFRTRRSHHRRCRDPRPRPLVVLLLRVLPDV